MKLGRETSHCWEDALTMDLMNWPKCIFSTIDFNNSLKLLLEAIEIIESKTASDHSSHYNREPQQKRGAILLGTQDVILAQNTLLDLTT